MVSRKNFNGKQKMKKSLFALPVLVAASVVIVCGTNHEPPPATMLARQLVEERQALGPLPKAVVPESRYDFGMMEPLATGMHAFTVRNGGDAPLELSSGTTTCKCTLSKITKPVVPPGETGEVQITWNTGRSDPYYLHGATIRTNDPIHRTIDLRVSGRVRVQIGAEPKDLVLPHVEPDKASTIHTTIYSQVWDAFSIADVVSSLPEANWSVESADPRKLESLKAKWGQQLTVVLPDGLQPGHFNDTLTVQVLPKGEATPVDLEVSLSGKVVRRLAVYGPGVETSGTVDLGILKQGEGLRRRLVMKVRDDQSDLVIRRIETTPDFLHVSVTPHTTKANANGLYYLDIEIPKNAPECAFRTEMGKLKLLIEHPRIDDLTLDVRFAVRTDDIRRSS
jgi:hypothetical protein